MEPLRRNDVAGPRRQDFIDSVTALIVIPIQSTRRRAEALGISLSLMEIDLIC